MENKDKDFDIERREYDEEVEKIRKEKRKLRDIQEPGLVKKIKKDLKRKQRAAKRSNKNGLRNYLKDEVNNYHHKQKKDEDE